MTLEQFYSEIGGNYEEAMSRIPKEALLLKLIKMFPKDENMENLKQSLAASDVQASFRAIHTLKGVSLNMSFSKLSAACIELTELLRAGKLEGTDAPFASVCKEYDIIIDAIKRLDE